jgi:hypothetical protein
MKNFSIETDSKLLEYILNENYKISSNDKLMNKISFTKSSIKNYKTNDVKSKQEWLNLFYRYFSVSLDRGQLYSRALYFQPEGKIRNNPKKNYRKSQITRHQ